MIQHLIQPRPDAPVARQIASLIEQGQLWFTLRLPSVASRREVAAAIAEGIAACKDSEAVLVVDGYPDLALETLVDGVRASGTVVSAAHGDLVALREKLGPHAIIGYAATSPDEILRLARLDVDYFTLPAEAMSAALAEVDTPIVAVGADTLPAGFDGILL